MSDDVNVHLWLPSEDGRTPPETLGSALESVALSKISAHQEARFLRLRVYEVGYATVLLDEALSNGGVSEILAKVKPYTGSRVRFEVASTFDYATFVSETRKLETRRRPLTINYFGPEYDWQGFPYKSYGPIRLDFSNTKSFRVQNELIDYVRKVASSGGDTTAGLKMIAQVRKNFDAVISAAKRLIQKMDPAHLLICTDLEVHPLTAHAIYHRDWRDYSKDLQKIARLHEFGGVYFCEVTPDEPAFIAARSSSLNYGYLRGPHITNTASAFVDALQPLVDAVVEDPSIVELSISDIEDVFTSLSLTNVEELNDSYFLTVNDAPFGYLEEPYFKLFERVRNDACSPWQRH